LYFIASVKAVRRSSPISYQPEHSQLTHAGLEPLGIEAALILLDDAAPREFIDVEKHRA
jgi:hypothetical protein